VKHAYIAVVAMMAASLSTGTATAQSGAYDKGPEEIGAEESPIPDPDIETDVSRAELEKIEALDGKDVTAEAAAPEEGRKGRGCAVDSSSSTPSRAPVAALLFVVGLLGLARRAMYWQSLRRLGRD